MAAALVNGDRRAALKRIKAPTVVIHCADDPLVPIEGVRDTAANIAGTELVEISGMSKFQAWGMTCRSRSIPRSLTRSNQWPNARESLRRRRCRSLRKATGIGKFAGIAVAAR
jgi:hypothetical protein